jgi:hypothetical protein
MSNVIDFQKYLGKRRDISPAVPSKFKPPKVYNIRIERTDIEDGSYQIEYDVSNKKLSTDQAGREVLFEHLLLLIVSMCYDDPAHIVELQNTLESCFDLYSEGEE